MEGHGHGRVSGEKAGGGGSGRCESPEPCESLIGED